MKKRTVAISAFMALSVALAGCSASTNTGSKANAATYHHLTQKDVLNIFQPGVAETYQDIKMNNAVKSASPSDLQLTNAQVQEIKSKHLKIALEWDSLDDPGKWELAGIKDMAKKLGITVAQTWVATNKSGLSQVDDYQQILPTIQNYDAFFTLPVDSAGTSSILQQIMKKTDVGFVGSAPFNIDWNDPHFVGVSDADGYLAGKYSAEAAVKILNGKGTIGEVGWVNGKNGAFHTVQVRYQGWNDVLKNNKNVKVVQAWYDNPANASQVISSMLASHPDINLLLVDFANPPADQAQQILKQRGLKPWKNTAMVTIDTDNTIAVPMAQNGPNNNYTAVYVTQTWYNVGENMIAMYANHLLNGSKAPKFVASPPLPVTTWNNLKTNYTLAVPSDWQTPSAIQNLTNQWPLGVPNEWK